MARKDIIMPTEEEGRQIDEAARSDPDALPLTDEELARFRRVRGPQKAPVKKQVTIRLDADLVERLKADGQGWQTRANDLLRRAMGL